MARMSIMCLASILKAPPVNPNFLRRRMKRFRSQNCPLDLPTYPHPHVLIAIYGRNTLYDCFSCGKQKPFITKSEFYYHCATCDVDFHDGCHKFPRKVTHPYHLQHPLTLTFRNFETGIISDGNINESFYNAVLCDSGEAKSESNAADPNMSRSMDIIVDKCTWCGNSIQGKWFYRCSTCNFCLDLSCYKNVPPLIIQNPKSHHHSLFFYPRPLLTPCDACGIVDVVEPSYACFQCNYMVHQSCIDLPRIIKITRHRHRLTHTPYLQPVISPCRICYKTVDGKYGQYYCNQEDCFYVVHSKCATHENVWDGKELEWEPEEPDETEDIAPFRRVSRDLIKHFSHDHFLKLMKYDGVRDAEKQCQACILLINSHDFYNCIRCDFFLHEVCAGLLRKLDHALHVHTLVLDPSPEISFFEPIYHKIGCSVCSRKFSGFRYKCSKGDCVIPDAFQIDVRCVLVSDYFTHKCHEHPLFICTSAYSRGKNKICCRVCKEICSKSYIQCTLCKFAMCYRCTTIPNEVSYKYDKHPLSLCYGEKTDGVYWCEVCEKEVDPTDWFYACNECCVTIHLQCVIGSSIYMKPGFKFQYLEFSNKVEVFSNSNSTRPHCHNCGHHCPGYIYYISHWYGEFKCLYLCSLTCLEQRYRH